MSNIPSGEPISALFGNPVKFVVPRYQRKYVWSKKNWQDLLDDITFLYNSYDGVNLPEHFLSSIILEETKKENGIQYYNIIDGQQRITTLMILFSVFARINNEIKNPDGHRLYRQFFCAIGTKGDEIKFDNAGVDMAIEILSTNKEYVADISSLPPVDPRKLNKITSKEEKNIYECYYYLYAEIKKLIESSDAAEYLKQLELFASIVTNMVIYKIVTKDQQTGYDIFEILNARGTPLAEHELLKNYIFKYYQPSASIDNAKKLWNKIENEINRVNDVYLEYFIEHYTIHRYEKPTKENNVLRIIKNNNQRNNTEAILNDIYNKALLYKYFIEPKQILDCYFLSKRAQEKIYQVLMYFSIKNFVQFRPLFLSILSVVKSSYESMDYKAESDEKKITKIHIGIEDKAIKAFVHLQNFIIVYSSILKLAPKEIESDIHSLAQKIESKETDFEPIFDRLKNVVQYTSFENRFIELGYSNKNKLFYRKRTKEDIRQLMRMFELYLQKTDELTVDNFTIEHISNDSEKTDYISKFGNLIPLAEELQGEIGEMTQLKDKVPIYKKSSFKYVQWFLKDFENTECWDEQAITRKSKEMAKLFYDKIFKLGEKNNG